MKTLVFYNKETGAISFTQEINGDIEYNYIIEEIPTDKIPISVNIEDKACVLDDTQVVKDKKEKIRKQLELANVDVDANKTSLLQKQLEIIELTYKFLEV